jgi:Bacterial SH3 domain
MKFPSAAAYTAAFAVLVVLSPVCASAAPGVVNTTVNLRQGPGTSTPIVGKIPAGSQVEIGSCSGEWCQATFQGMSGYVIATALAQGGAPPSGRPPGTLPPGSPPPPGYAGPPPGYGPPPPGYAGPPPGYGGPAPYPYPGPGPYYGPYYYGYGPYWRRW